MNKKSQAMLKVKMMKESVRCLAFGLASLLPVIGVLWALPALACSFSARQKEKLFWNPARPHRIIGLISATIGGLIWGAFATIVIFHMLNPGE
jgi:hypothetical protein